MSIFNRKWSKPLRNKKKPKSFRQQKVQNPKDISGKQSDDNIIMNYLKEDAFVTSLELCKDECNTLNFIEEQLWDI